MLVVKSYEFGYLERHRFDNGYGVSIARNPGTYGNTSGRYELAIIKWKIVNGEWEWDFGPPIFDNKVYVGWLDYSDTSKYIDLISNLPKAELWEKYWYRKHKK